MTCPRSSRRAAVANPRRGALRLGMAAFGAVWWLLLRGTSLVGAEELKSDLLVLADGQRLEGSILNETFRFRTPYANLVLDKNRVRELNLSELSGGLHSVVTVSGERLTGLLEEPVLVLALAAGEKLEIRREKAARVALRRPASESHAATGRNRSIWLRNGDRLSGEFAADHLRLVTDHGQVRIGVLELSTLGFSRTNPALATVSLRDGQTLQGRLDTEDIEFKLGLGLQLAIHHQGILEVGDTAGASQGTGAASGLAMTNRPGLIWIPPGWFMMGSPPEEQGRDPDEGPQTRVTISKGFWIGRCEVSQGEFQQVMSANPSHAVGEPTRPVEKVTWFEAVEYCQKLTALEQAQGRLPEGYAYRLPTEAEWEYACRAGTSTRFSYGDDRNETQLGDHAWFARNSESMTQPVGAKRPNPWGLHDMHGNVWEWCLDRWEGKYPGGGVTNVPVTARGTLRVTRGGSWLYEAKGCRSANRDDYGPNNRCSDLGFRVVLAPLDLPA